MFFFTFSHRFNILFLIFCVILFYFHFRHHESSSCCISFLINRVKQPEEIAVYITSSVMSCHVTELHRADWRWFAIWLSHTSITLNLWEHFKHSLQLYFQLISLFFISFIEALDQIIKQSSSCRTKALRSYLVTSLCSDRGNYRIHVYTSQGFCLLCLFSGQFYCLYSISALASVQFEHKSQLRDDTRSKTMKKRLTERSRWGYILVEEALQHWLFCFVSVVYGNKMRNLNNASTFFPQKVTVRC